MQVLFGIRVSDTLGEKIVEKILVDNGNDQPPTMPGCSHPVRPLDKFCSQCGNPAQIRNPKWGLTSQQIRNNLQHYAQPYGFCWQYDGSDYYIGIGIYLLNFDKSLRQIQKELSDRIQQAFDYYVNPDDIYFVDAS